MDSVIIWESYGREMVWDFTFSLYDTDRASSGSDLGKANISPAKLSPPQPGKACGESSFLVHYSHNQTYVSLWPKSLKVR